MNIQKILRFAIIFVMYCFTAFVLYVSFGTNGLYATLAILLTDLFLTYHLHWKDKA
jgi:hypothetical protein